MAKRTHEGEVGLGSPTRRGRECLHGAEQTPGRWRHAPWEALAAFLLAQDDEPPLRDTNFQEEDTSTTGSLCSARGLSGLASPPLPLAFIFTIVQRGLFLRPRYAYFPYTRSKGKPGVPSEPAGSTAVIATWWGKQVPPTPRCPTSPLTQPPSLPTLKALLTPSAGAPSSGRLWATREEEELSWAAH